MLSNDQIEFFNLNGYLVIEDVVNQRTILDPIRDEYGLLLDRLISDWVKKNKVSKKIINLNFQEKLLETYKLGLDWFQPFDISLPGDTIKVDTPMHFSSNMFNLLKCEKILDIVEQIIGPEITSNPIQHIRLKPPTAYLRKQESRAHVSKTDWHQDRGVTLEDADYTQMITVWVAVTDASLSNGCLKVIPKGSIDKLLPHCPQRQTAIAKDFISEADAISLPVKSGGLIIIHPLTPHSSLDNVSNDFRWSFDIRYNRSGESTGRQHFPEFIARSKSEPHTELKDWKTWKTMWEETRRSLSNRKHIKIHRWDSNSPYCA